MKNYVIQYINRSKTMSENRREQQIKKNRLNIRNSLVTTLSKGGKFVQEKNKDKDNLQASKVTKTKKNTSDNLRKFSFLSKYNDPKAFKSFDTDFELLNYIGEGAHSVVYKCMEKSTKRLYAVKITKNIDEERLENLIESYQIMNELEHESILQGKYLYINKDHMTSHMVSQLCNYPELRTFMMKNRNLDEEKVASIINKIIEVLSYLYEKGVCHRDIKPQNILYNPETQEIKIIDLELAKMQRYHHQKLDLWSSTGSLHYRAPETFHKGYGLSIDIWSVGIICYEMLTNKLPFNSKFVAQMSKDIRQKQIDFENLAISSEAKKFLKKILNKNPDERIKPRQAISHPFLLKNAHISSVKKLNTTSDDLQMSDTEEQESELQKRFYDESTPFLFINTINSDIGIRYCKQ